MTQTFKRTLLCSVLMTTFLSQSNIAFAKPELKPLPANIAEIGSQYYDFKIKEFHSIDKKTTYKVWLGIPKKVALPKHGSTAIFMLDGNAAMSHLDEKLLKKLNENHAPVLVAIGYKTKLPFDTQARTLDYTPADPILNQPSPDPRNAERMSGGSKNFQKLITEQIAPWVEKNIKINPKQRSIWGHSYGGLFVLDYLISGSYFSHYYAASPSLTWADERILNKIRSSSITLPHQKTILLMEGDVITHSHENQSKNFDADSITKNRELLLLLNQDGVNAKFLIYPNLKHGDVFKASLLDVLNSSLP